MCCMKIALQTWTATEDPHYCERGQRANALQIIRGCMANHDSIHWNLQRSNSSAKWIASVFVFVFMCHSTSIRRKTWSLCSVRQALVKRLGHCAVGYSPKTWSLCSIRQKNLVLCSVRSALVERLGHYIVCAEHQLTDLVIMQGSPSFSWKSWSLCRVRWVNLVQRLAHYAVFAKH